MKISPSTVVTAERNREIYAAVAEGKSIEDLAAKYGLSAQTVQSILTGERHKRSVSPHAFYREVRANELAPAAQPKAKKRK